MVIENYALTVLDNLQQINALEQEWNELHRRCGGRSIYNSFDFVYTSIKHFLQPQDELCVVVIRQRDDQALVAIFPCCISDYYWRLGTFRAMLIVARDESDKAYPIIESEHEKKVWPVLLSYFKRIQEKWSFIDFEEFKPDSLAIPAVKSSFDKGYLVHTNPDAVSPLIDLTMSWQAFWDQHRKMRKRVRKMEKTLAENFRFEVIERPQEILQSLQDYIDLEKRSWKLEAKVGIGKDAQTIAFYRDYFSQLALKNKIKFGFLYNGEQLVSAEIAYIEAEQVFFSHGCYDNQFKQLSPGMVSTSLFLKHFFEGKYQTGDFLGGFAQYINPWASELLPSINIIVIKVSPKTLLFYLLDFFRRKIYKPIKSSVLGLLKRSSQTK